MSLSLICPSVKRAWVDSVRSSLCLEGEIQASPASSRHCSATQVCHPPTHTSISSHGTHRHTSVGAYTDSPAEKAEARARGRPLLVVTVSLASFPPLTNLSSREPAGNPSLPAGHLPPGLLCLSTLPNATHRIPRAPSQVSGPDPGSASQALPPQAHTTPPQVSPDRHGTARNDHPHSLPPAHNLPYRPLSRPLYLACSHRPRRRTHTRTHYSEPKFPSTDILYSLAVQLCAELEGTQGDHDPSLRGSRSRPGLREEARRGAGRLFFP